jgi:hypothetical protein
MTGFGGQDLNPFYKDWRVIKYAYMARNPETNHTFSTLEDACHLAHLVMRWKESNQDSFLDVAIQFCDDKDLPILNELREYLAEAARGRNPYYETKAFLEGVKGQAFLAMAQLIYQGATLAEAAGKAAAWMFDNGTPMKASTLEKQYTAKFRSGAEPLETVYFEGWDAYDAPEIDKAQIEQRESLRWPTEEEVGNRRQ